MATKIYSKDTSTGTIKVSTSKGRDYEFDEVVLTAPLGWVKKNLDAFEPRLPLRLEKAIKNIGYGALEKVEPLAEFFGSWRAITDTKLLQVGIPEFSKSILA